MARNSTTVRSVPVPEQALRAGMQLLSAVSPGAAAVVAEQMFMRPPPPRAERRKLEGGERFTVRADGVKVAAWSYGTGPAVYLLHGWAGHAGQLRAFVDPLVKSGRRAVLFDAPAHGDSTGWQTSILRFALALEAVAAKAGEASGVIAHSMGGSAAAFAHHRGLPIGKLALLGVPSHVNGTAEQFARRVGLSDAAQETMNRRIERRLAITYADLDLRRPRASMRAQLLLVHDSGDSEVSSNHAEWISSAWPGSKRLTTTGLGHYRIMRDPKVVSEVVGFITGEAPTPVAS
jgi:hypothetical protein